MVSHVDISGENCEIIVFDLNYEEKQKGYLSIRREFTSSMIEFSDNIGSESNHEVNNVVNKLLFLMYWMYTWL